MKNIFNVKVSKFSNVLELEGVWGTDALKGLLDALEYEDYAGLSAEDLRDVCFMSLQDLKPAEAAYSVLKFKMSEFLKEGQLRNISVEMLDEKLWEEYSDHSLHERFFNVGSFLFAAFPNVFPKPDAVLLKIEILAENEPAKALLGEALDESFLVRLVSDGMDPEALLHRIFEDQLKGNSFPEAENIIWTVNVEPATGGKRTLSITSSGCWLDPLANVDGFTSTAYSDRCQK